MAQDYYVTPTPQASRFSKKTILVGGGLVLALIIGVVMLTSGGNSSTKQLQHLSLRLGALQTLLENPKIKTDLKDQSLLQITSELKLSLTTSANELAPLLTSAGMPIKFDESIVASETDTSSATKLEEAALNAKFDRVYAETLLQKIISMRALTAETFKAVKGQKLKVALVSLDKNLNSAKKRLDKLSL